MSLDLPPTTINFVEITSIHIRSAEGHALKMTTFLILPHVVDIKNRG
jgi:hypothetical protein